MESTYAPVHHAHRLGALYGLSCTLDRTNALFEGCLSRSAVTLPALVYERSPVSYLPLTAEAAKGRRSRESGSAGTGHGRVLGGCIWVGGVGGRRDGGGGDEESSGPERGRWRQDSIVESMPEGEAGRLCLGPRPRPTLIPLVTCHRLALFERRCTHDGCPADAARRFTRDSPTREWPARDGHGTRVVGAQGTASPLRPRASTPQWSLDAICPVLAHSTPHPHHHHLVDHPPRQPKYTRRERGRDLRLDVSTRLSP
ncbi:hypothetical protein RSOLAG22IIIB_13965 [Rhizoctonia solani]|uniref:Uncharacterized protein n=1 Tax=Rhizoctonia solani TaxID=456999 RepID=A0A0K6FT23_9AGAM|nr:hypothetical protein RSOLAG22IIIB_13965 [Rhizoctonia solani]